MSNTASSVGTRAGIAHKNKLRTQSTFTYKLTLTTLGEGKGRQMSLLQLGKLRHSNAICTESFSWFDGEPKLKTVYPLLWVAAV